MFGKRSQTERPPKQSTPVRQLKRARAMSKVLLTIDGSESSDRAVKHLIHMVKSSQPMDVHLLNVQPPIMSGEISPIVTTKMLGNLQHDKGEKTAVSARAMLNDAGIQYTFRIELGHIAETIAQYAQNNQCEQIIMGTRGMGAMGKLVLGSVATKVIHLVDVPVTLVK